MHPWATAESRSDAAAIICSPTVVAHSNFGLQGIHSTSDRYARARPPDIRHTNRSPCTSFSFSPKSLTSSKPSDSQLPPQGYDYGGIAAVCKACAPTPHENKIRAVSFPALCNVVADPGPADVVMKLSHGPMRSASFTAAPHRSRYRFEDRSTPGFRF